MTSLRIEVGYDLVCPWCLIGKRLLERALADFHHLHPDVAVELSWHSVQLLPDLPDAGLPFDEFYLRRLGSAAAVAARQAQVAEFGRAAGLEFDFRRIKRMPNTLAAHGLVAAARAQGGAGLEQAAVEALFDAYFGGGADLGDAATLQCIADRLGVEPVERTPALPPGNGANAVPWFRFNGSYLLSGAQAPERLLDLMRQCV